MGNPKFIPTQKKVTYSFRVEEENLDKLKQISELNDIKLPKLMSHIIEDYLVGKIVYNTYLEGFEGMFIDLPDITEGREYDEFQEDYIWYSDLTFEYEIKQIPNNLDRWDPIFLTYRSYSQHYGHEGVEFLIVPEICEYEGKCYTDLTKYLYCIYFTVRKNSSQVEIHYISFLEAINKLKKSENYPLLNNALKLRDILQKRSNELRNHISQVGDNVFEFEYIWSELNRIAREFNSGNIIPIEKSKKDIKYKASLQSINDEETYDLVSEFERIKKEMSKYGQLYKRVYKYLEKQGLSDKEIMEIMNKDKPTFDLSE